MLQKASNMHVMLCDVCKRISLAYSGAWAAFTCLVTSQPSVGHRHAAEGQQSGFGVCRRIRMA